MFWPTDKRFSKRFKSNHFFDHFEYKALFCRCMDNCIKRSHVGYVMIVRAPVQYFTLCGIRFLRD